MKIGIIYYSHSGNTKSVVEKIEESLIENDNTVEIISLPTKERSDGKRELYDVPKIPVCDRLIFASHVEAFSLEPVMKKYLTQMDEIPDKEVICYVSQGLPKKWMGAKGTLKTMKKLAENKGGKVIMTESASFFEKNDTDSEIIKIVSDINKLF